MQAEVTKQQTSPDFAEQLPVFVYGTLRTGQGNWTNILKGATLNEIPAVLPKAKMYSPGIAYVTDAGVDKPESQVVGDLMFVDPSKWLQVLSRLDRLEGFVPGSKDNHYERVARLCTYTDAAGQIREILAWVYFGSCWALKRCAETELVADGDWLAHLKRPRKLRH